MNAAPDIPKDDFDWRSDDSVVLREQLSIAVYSNTMGGVVIRRERYWDEDDDCVVSFQPQNVDRVCEALKAAAREALAMERMPIGAAAARTSRSNCNGQHVGTLPLLEGAIA
jgi:hypothetical protein